jgi:hypothetical protein
MLADGRLHLTAVAKLAGHLTPANRDDLLARATHRSKREVEELIAELAPRPEVAPAIRRLPSPRQTVPSPAGDGRPSFQSSSRPSHAATSPQATPPSLELGPDRVEPMTLTPPPHPPRVEPLAPTRYKVQFTASAQLREKLERLQALCPGDDVAEVIEQAVTERLERLEARRFAKVAKPRSSLAGVASVPSSRYIPAPVRRAVHERDGGRCTFTDSQGRRCSSRQDLEFHHHERPYGRGGEHSVRNLRLMCPTHNALLAERDYGAAAMERHRRSEGRVSEGGTPYGHSVVGMPLPRHLAAG